MYGTCDEDGEVQVDFIYEPPQTGTETSLVLHRNKGIHTCAHLGSAAFYLYLLLNRGQGQSGCLLDHSLARSKNRVRLTCADELKSAVRAARSLMLPPCHPSADEEQCVDTIAAGVGMRRVGFIFTRSAAQSGEEERDYTLSAAEIRLAAELHAEALGLPLKKLPEPDEAMADANGIGTRTGTGNGSAEGAGAAEGEEGFKQFAIGVVQLQPDEEGVGSVHFEAFQLSDQCVKLFADGLFADPEEEPGSSGAEKGKGPERSKEEKEEDGPGVTRMRKEVIVARKDTFVVDNDFFLLTVSIKSHEVRCQSVQDKPDPCVLRAQLN